MEASAERASPAAAPTARAERGRRIRFFPTARKVLELFPRRERWKLGGIFVAMVVTGLLQTAGIASITPFIGLAANPDLVAENESLARVYDALGFTSTEDFLLFLGIVVLVLVALTNASTALTMWLTQRFVWGNHHRISQELLATYLRKPYDFYLGRNTARLSKTLLGEVKNVIKSVLLPTLDVTSRAISAVLIVALLFVVDPLLAAVVALTLGGSYALVYLFVRRKQRHLGQRRVEAHASRYTVASEAFGGVKDVKALGREAYFVHRFGEPSREYARANASNAVVAQLPRFVLETIAFGGIMVVLLYLLRTREVAEVLPLIALYALAGSRLMPSLQQIFAGLTKIRFHAPAVDDLYADLAAVAPPTAARGSEPVLEAAPRLQRELRLSGVSYRYPSASGPALRGVDLVVPAGALVGLVGLTGSGKTTIADLLLGLLSPSEGAILVDGVPLDDASLPAWRTRVGYVPQSTFLLDDTVTRNVAYGVPDAELDRGAVERAVRAAGVERFVLGLPQGYETVVGERGIRLSGGERQRLGIARALYHDPALLVLDEATSALDPSTEEAVMSAIRRLSGQRTIVIISHRLTTVAACDAIHLLEDGAIAAQGTYDVLAATSPAFRALARIDG